MSLSLPLSEVCEEFPDRVIETVCMILSRQESDGVVEPGDAAFRVHHLVDNADEYMFLNQFRGHVPLFEAGGRFAGVEKGALQRDPCQRQSRKLCSGPQGVEK